MKLSNILSESSKPSLKEMTRFLYVLQSFLIESYPNFKTKIVKNVTNNNENEFPIVIEWTLTDATLYWCCYINRNNNLTIYLKNPDYPWLGSWKLGSISYINNDDTKNFFNADEIQFDIIELVKILLIGPNGTVSYFQTKQLLADANDGKITFRKHLHTGNNEYND